MLRKVCLAVLVSLPLAAPEASPAALASPDAYASNYGYHAQPVLAEAAPSSQFHAQDEFGQYNYGFSSPDQTKSEIKTADGVTRGAYSYVDANGIIQSVQYISDALGFRVAATNLPVHHVDAPVAAAALAPAAAPVVVAAAAPAMAPSVDYAYLPYAQGYNYYAPPTQYVPAPVVPAQYVQPAAPVVVAAPVVPVAHTGSQYHSQDDIGQYTFGYNDPNSVRQEVKTADGVVRGAYRYVDTNGILQTVEYIADAAGFRVAGTNLPQATVALPASVVDTPEVAAAKHAHAVAYAQAHAAAAVQPEDLSLYDTPVAQAVPLPAPIVFAEEPIQTVESLVDTRTPVVQSAQLVHNVAAPVHVAAPINVVAAAQGSQYHAQDNIGQYSYGYSDPNSVKQEIKTADGVTRGGYSYVDANGLVQTVNYISDAMGFRVAATNLPVHIVDTPVVAAPAVAAPVAAPVVAAPLPAPVAAAYHHQPVVAPQVNYAYLPYATNYGYTMPEGPVVVAAPQAVAAPAVIAAADGTNSQFHAQDEFGQYNYGFAHPTQTKQEVKTADGVTRGGYSYIDANGLVQTVNYISDAMGFRVAATNLPVHVVDGPVEPVAAAAAPIVAPAVTAAYHAAEVLTPQVQYSYLPYAQNYAYNTPAAPVVAAPSRPVTHVTHAAAAPVVHAAPAPVVYAAAAPVVHAAPAPVVYSAAPVHVVPAAVQGAQYHAQDGAGQYSFGYNDGSSVKQEIKTADGVVRGAYSYIDSDGIVQNVNYIADALGFRVGATNLPVHHVDAPVAAAAPVVAAAAAPAVVAAHYSAPAVAHQASPVIAPAVNYAYLPYASNYGYSLPEPVAAPLVAAPHVAAPLVVAAPIDTTNSQYHAQDDLGQYNYGYSDPNSVKQEVKTADGVTRGSYSYVDANGLIQTVNYISDAMGFRVAATNLPVHIVEGNAVEAVVEPHAYVPYAQNYGYTAAAAA